jgi:hypothetical protein
VGNSLKRVNLGCIPSVRCYDFSVPGNPIRSIARGGAAIVLASVLSVGCGNGPGRRIVAPTVEHGDPSELVTWLNIAPLAFRAGESIRIELGVRNPTTLPIVTKVSGCIYYEVADASNRAVTPVPICCFGPPTYELAPGDSLAGSFSWDGTGMGGSLPAGEYRVYAVGIQGTEPVSIQILAP